MKRKAMGLIAVAVFAADRVSKILAGGIPPEGIPLIPGVVRHRQLISSFPAPVEQRGNKDLINLLLFFI